MKNKSERIYVVRETSTRVEFGSLKPGDEFQAMDGNRWLVGMPGAGNRMVFGLTGEFKGKLIYPNHLSDNAWVYLITSHIVLDEKTKN